MVHCISLNPCIDYITYLDDFQIGEINRTTKTDIRAGGKAINVATVLSNLGLEPAVTGFFADFSGDYIIKYLKDLNILTNPIITRGHNRINIQLKHNNEHQLIETEINSDSLIFCENNINSLLSLIDRIQDNDTCVLSGSIPKAIPQNFYATICEHLTHKNTKIIVDTTPASLQSTLPFQPYLIKPNVKELQGLFNCKISSKSDAIPYAKKLQTQGAKNIIVSFDKEGAIMLCESVEIFDLHAPTGLLVDSVGAGDSLVAGFIYAKECAYNDLQAFKFAVATGSATAFSHGFADIDSATKLYEKT